MREPALGLRPSLLNGGSYLKRIRENVQSVWRLPLAPLPAVSAPIHLLDDDPRKANVGAQAGSVLIHGFLFGLLILTFTQWSAKQRAERSTIPYPHSTVQYWPLSVSRIDGPASLGKAGGGGDQNSLPPTAGNLASFSRIELAPPRLPDGRLHPLPLANTIFSEEAPEIAAPVHDLGLPWMSSESSSAGPGDLSIGNTPGNSMGRNGWDGNGEGENRLAYNRVASPVICRVCPDPLYSEEARKIKVQGSVLLSVLVGPDGRAKKIRVVRGLGSGLDENAEIAVRNWQFIPAKDASQQNVASWINVEAVFRLF